LFLPPDQVKIVEMVDDEGALEQLLTNKQRECVIAACSVGYYQTPKKTSLRQLSENLKIPRSTLQEHLSRAESNLMNWAAESLRKN
jgi:predicted DNA binding protein